MRGRTKRFLNKLKQSLHKAVLARNTVSGWVLACTPLFLHACTVRALQQFYRHHCKTARPRAAFFFNLYKERTHQDIGRA